MKKEVPTRDKTCTRLATSKRKKMRKNKRNKEGRKRGETEKEENKNRAQARCVLIGDGGGALLARPVLYSRALWRPGGAMEVEATLKEPWEREGRKRGGRGGRDGGHPERGEKALRGEGL